ncbi:hypothetical protein [Sphingobacterium sp. MYb388]|uniref:hypothetical protein n=1 Tax=Sphingobacterium sp. MYb388 TaxID=2745437 RepID=UPI0030B1913E
MVHIKLPQNISTKFADFEYLIDVQNYLKKNHSEQIVFDFSSVKFIEANICAFLGALNEDLTSRNNTIRYINVNPLIEDLLKRNNYFSNNEIGKSSLRSDTIVNYNRFGNKDENRFISYIENDLLGKKYFPKHSKDLDVLILRCIFELFDNARLHGNCKFIHTCGQMFPNKSSKPLNFSIVNLGKTIKQKVSHFLGENISGSQAIKWALIKGNTTKVGDLSGGLGFDVLVSFMLVNNGCIQIISGKGYYEFTAMGIIEKELNTGFNGTIINLVFNMEDKSYYSLDDSVVTVTNLF